MSNIPEMTRVKQLVDCVTFTIVGFSLTAMVMVAAQSGLFRWLDFEAAQDPVELVQRYELLVRWVAHPVAALAGGLVLAIVRPSGLAFAVTVPVVASPLLVSWLVLAEFEISNGLQCGLYLLIAAVPTLIVRRKKER